MRALKVATDLRASTCAATDKIRTATLVAPAVRLFSSATSHCRPGIALAVATTTVGSAVPGVASAAGVVACHVWPIMSQYACMLGMLGCLKHATVRRRNLIEAGVEAGYRAVVYMDIGARVEPALGRVVGGRKAR